MDWQFTAMAAARLPQLQAKTKTMDPWKPRVQWNLWTEERSRAKRNETKARGIKLSKSSAGQDARYVRTLGFSEALVFVHW